MLHSGCLEVSQCSSLLLEGHVCWQQWERTAVKGTWQLERPSTARRGRGGRRHVSEKTRAGALPTDSTLVLLKLFLLMLPAGNQKHTPSPEENKNLMVN